MKEHKNPKVLSEGIVWMVSAVEDFGVSHLKLKVFCSILNISIMCSLVFVSFGFLIINCNVVVIYSEIHCNFAGSN
jgi:hypothetical protein